MRAPKPLRQFNDLPPSHRRVCIELVILVLLTVNLGYAAFQGGYFAVLSLATFIAWAWVLAKDTEKILDVAIARDRVRNQMRERFRRPPRKIGKHSGTHPRPGARNQG